MGPMGPIGPMVRNRHLKFIRRPSKLTYVDIQERKSLKCLGSILLPSPVFKLDRWLLWHPPTTFAVWGSLVHTVLNLQLGILITKLKSYFNHEIHN